MSKKIIGLLLAVSMLFGMFMTCGTAYAFSTRMPFDDVRENHWARDIIEYVYTNDLMYGTGGLKFEPDTAMTRAMFVTLLGRYGEAQQNNNSNFTDVEPDSWYGGYVGWAYENNIVEGFKDGTFRPDAKMTREQMAAVISRYISYAKITLEDDPSAVPSFADSEKIQKWARDDVETLRKTGIAEGDQYKKFNPSSSLTRAEAAAVVMRLDKKIKEANETDLPVLSYDRETSTEYKVWGAKHLYYAGTGLYANMSSELAESEGELPTLDFTCVEGATREGQKLNSYNLAKAPWYVGVSPLILTVDLEKYPVFSIRYKTSGSSEMTGVLYTERYEYETSVTGVGSGDGWYTATIDVNEFLPSDIELVSKDDNFVRLYFYPFGKDDSTGEFSVQYAGFFPTKESANGFNPDDISDYMNTYYSKYDFDWRELTDDVAGKYDDIVDARTDSIINSTNDIDPATINGECYYISSVNGDDSNDGKSPETSWKSISKLYTTKFGETVSILKSGDAVFFERGSVFYPSFETNYSGDTVLDGAASGVTYSAYGKGDKPLFTNALDVNGSMDWESTGFENVWRLEERLQGKEDSPAYCDVGNIVFNDGEGWGIKVLPYNLLDPYKAGVKTVDSGMVSNGYESYHSGGTEFTSPGSLANNLEFFHDYSDGSLYLYFDKGNPGEYFDKIVVSLRGDIMSLGSVKDVVLDNLAVKYGGAHGIDMYDVTNIEIQNCDIQWIGGSLQGGDGKDKVRFGNAVQNWAECDGLYVHDCFMSQIYDGTLSSQVGGSASVMQNIELYDNVLTLGNSPIEIWGGSAYEEDGTPSSIYKNIWVHDNYMMYTGYHFGHQRPSKNASFNSGTSQCTENWIMENNVCLYSSVYAFVGWNFVSDFREYGIESRNNVYALNAGRDYFYRGYENPIRMETGDSVKKPEYICYPYTQRYMQYLSSLGIEKGTTFYYYTEDLFEEEASGVYR